MDSRNVLHENLDCVLWAQCQRVTVGTEIPHFALLFLLSLEKEGWVLCISTTLNATLEGDTKAWDLAASAS